MGELYREKRISVMNLAMGRYAPQHYREAYKEFVIKEGVSHKYVLIFFYMGNDISDSIVYSRLLKKGKDGDYRDYGMRGYKGSGNESLPWIINLITGSVRKTHKRGKTDSN